MRCCGRVGSDLSIAVFRAGQPISLGPTHVTAPRRGAAAIRHIAHQFDVRPGRIGGPFQQCTAGHQEKDTAEHTGHRIGRFIQSTDRECRLMADERIEIVRQSGGGVRAAAAVGVGSGNAMSNSRDWRS